MYCLQSAMQPGQACIDVTSRQAVDEMVITVRASLAGLADFAVYSGL